VHPLHRHPWGGRPQRVRRDRRAEILATTLSPPPQALGVPHWSSRLLAGELGVSHSTVARVWAEHDIRPWQTETFTFSIDPQLDARVRDLVGRYLDPPAHGPMAPGRPERRTHHDLRHATTTLFAALAVATGRVTDAGHPRPPPRRVPRLPQAPRHRRPRRQLQLVLDNDATHKHATVQAWLSRHPRLRLQYTPTDGG
jgi:hypothetical protein